MIERSIKYSHEEWLTLRKQYIGASEIAKACGVSDYETPYDIYMRKKDNTRKEQNPKMSAGLFMEQPIFELFQAKMHLKDVPYESQVIYIDKQHGLLATLDYELVINGKKVIVECKNTTNESAWNGDQPIDYIYQIQQGIMLSGADYGYFAVYINGWDFRTIKVARDQHIIDCIIAGARRYYDIAESENAEELFLSYTDVKEKEKKKTYNKIDNDYAEELFNERHSLSIAIEDLKQRKKDIEDKILGISNKKNTLFNGKCSVTISKCSGKKFDEDKLKQENPALYKKYLRKYGYNRTTFTIRGLKAKQDGGTDEFTI